MIPRRVRRFPLALLTSALALVAAPACALDSRDVDFDGAMYRVVRVDLARERLELLWRDAAGAPYAGIDGVLRAADAQGRRLLFATNAGMYDRQFRPLGLHIEEGRTLRPLNTARGEARSGNFSMQPNGVFYVGADGRGGVLTTAAWQTANIPARLATQSGPMLLVDGAINDHFVAGSDSLKWRSGVCAATPAQAVFAVSSVPVSFHAFARLFRDELGCRDALYLDGSLSRIYTDADGYAGAPAFVGKPYVGILALFDAPR